MNRLNDSPDFRRLFSKTAFALFLCSALVAFCYFFVDRPVAYFVHDHDFACSDLLKWLTYPPPYMQAWAPLVLAILMVLRIARPPRPCEKALLAACVAIILAEQFKDSLKFVFGRYWPETWINNNPSLIRDGAYGFHPFQGGDAYRSFPSGHTARIVAVAAVLWIACPRWRWAALAASLAVAAGLLAMNYHFVGDVIAGAFVGGIVGTYTAYCCGLRRGETTGPPRFGNQASVAA